MINFITKVAALYVVLEGHLSLWCVRECCLSWNKTIITTTFLRHKIIPTLISWSKNKYIRRCQNIFGGFLIMWPKAVKPCPP